MAKKIKKAVKKAVKKAASKKAAKPKAGLDDNQTEQVNAFMSKLKHPLKAEIEAVRSIIKNAHPAIKERVKLLQHW